jgi:hypothetical protein
MVPKHRGAEKSRIRSSSLLYMYKCVRFVMYDGLFLPFVSGKFFLFLVFHMQDKYVNNEYTR